MKFGETSDSIYSVSFSVEEGYSTPEWPFDQAVKILRAIDGSIIDVINFGAREHRTAEFTLNYITRANHYTVKTYFEANLGKKVRVEMENAGERVFGEQFTGPVFYAYLLKAKSIGETGFSGAHTLYGYSMSLDYAGANSTSVPNAADTSQYDFLLKGDCARITAGCQVTDLTALNAITTKPGGSRGLTTSNMKVYFYNSDPAVLAWEYQYTLPANDAAQGLKYGIFRLSAFADISGASTGIGGEDFKSGWIGKRSIKFPRYSVDARLGPAVERPEAFQFAIDNSSKRWKYPLDNNLAFYGSYWELYCYDRVSGVLQLMRSGYNNRNSFDYSWLTFEIEPSVLQTKSFPTTLIGKDNFPNADTNVRGKPLQATYGRFDLGELQTVAFNMDPVRFPAGKKILNVLGWNSSTKVLDLDLDYTEVTKVLGYTPSSYPATLTQFFFVAITSQQNQSDLNKLKRVTAIASNSGKARFTLSDGFANTLDTTGLMTLYLSNVQILVDDDAIVGMQSADYLRKGSSDGTAPLELYAKQGDTITKIPGHTFKVVSDGKKNQITIDTNNISLQSAGELVTSDESELTNLPATSLHSIVDKTHVNGYSYFDFGFSPKGIESNEIVGRPFDRITFWGTDGSTLPLKERNRNNVGKIVAVFSKNFTTLIWTPFQGATGYRFTRYIITPVDGEQPSYSKDMAFGGGGGMDLSDGTHPSVSGGVVTISGGAAGVGDGTAFVLIDKSIDVSHTVEYVYTIEPLVPANITLHALASNSGKNVSVPQGIKGFDSIGKPSSVVLAWQVPDDQASYTINQDGADISGMPVSVATKGWHQVTGLTNDQEYKFKVFVNCLAIGTGGDVWFYPANNFSDHGIHQLLRSGDPYVALPYDTLRDSKNCDLKDPSDLAYVNHWGVVTRKIKNDGFAFPAAGVVFSWLWKLDRDAHPELKDMGGATDVRLLADFVARSYVGDNTQVPIIIQLRGLRADKSVSFTTQYSSLTCKAPTEAGSYGAYAKFLNLPGQLNGTGSNSNYDTAASADNANALYTGKDLWRLPDYLFDDDGAEWDKIEYFMFSITNSTTIPFANVSPWPGAHNPGYSQGIGGPPDAAWGMVQYHKPLLYLECLRKFDGGLKQPLYTRIDGGKVDDGSGTATGTAGQIIEKARHVINDVLYSLTGKLPVYIGDEMKSRDSWIWRWQTKMSKPLTDTLQTLVDNIFGIAVLTPDDNISIRTLNIDEPNSTPVFNFTDSNIIVDSLIKPEGRRRNEIFQKFLAKYNIEPSKGGIATEEMLVGWNLATNKPIYSGYPRSAQDANGNVYDVDGLDNLADLCRLSTQLYAAGGAINEFGTDPTKEQVFEMFYRPTKASSLAGQPIERDLPNLDTLWALTAKQPKMAMQSLFRMLVRFHCFDAWYFPLACSMKNVIYNTAITEVKDEAGTPDHRLKLGSQVTVTSDFHTNGQAVKGIILDIDPSTLYDGYATLHVFAPRPPGQFGTFIDPIWDASGPGARNENNYLFSGTLYGLLNEDATFADAGAPGARDQTQEKFPDSTFADSKGSGSGKA